MNQINQPNHALYPWASAAGRHIPRCLALLGAAGLLAIPTLSKANATWTGGGPDANFTDTANWQGNTVPGGADPGSTSTATTWVFGSAVVNGYVALPGSVVGDLLLTTGLNQDVTIADGVLEEWAGQGSTLGLIDMSTSTGNLWLSSPTLNIESDVTWNVGSAVTMTIYSAITQVGGPFNLTKNGAGPVVMTTSSTFAAITNNNGLIQYQPGAGPNDPYITGAGSMEFEGNGSFTQPSTYTGGTVIGAMTGTEIIMHPGCVLGTGPISVGNGNTAHIVVWAGTPITINNDLTLNSMGTAQNRGCIDHDGGPGLVTLNGNITLAGDSRVGVGGGSWNNMIINGKISGANKLYVYETSAISTTLANANNDWTGGLEVEGGQTIVGASGAVGSGPVAVDAGGVLLGAGKVLGPVTVNGTLQPGLGGTDTSPLTINNTVTLAGNTLIAINRDATSKASTIKGITSLTLGGTLTVTNMGSTPQVGDSFTLYQANSTSGSFSATNLPTLGGTLFWVLNNGTLSVSATPAAPVFSASPGDQIRYVHGAVTFTPTLWGYPVPTFQWKYNGSTIAGATNSTLTLSDLQLTNAGSYVLYATNSQGNASSTPANLSIRTPAGYEAAVVARNPMSYWRFSEGGGSNAFDYINGVLLVDTNSSPLQAGPQAPEFPGLGTSNTAAQFNGSEGFASTSQMFQGLSDFSLMGWFNIDPNSYPLTENADGRASLFGEQWTAELAFYQGTNLYFYSSGIAATIFITNGFTPGDWHFLAVVSDTNANLTTVYLDGVAAGTGSVCPGTQQPYYFCVGDYISNFPNIPSPFFGGIDEVAAFNHSLKAADITAIWNAAVAFPVTITAQPGGCQIAWPLGHLQSAPTLNGPWTTMTTAVSPLKVTASSQMQFYRAVNP